MGAEVAPARRAAARAGVRFLAVLGALPGLLGAAAPPAAAPAPSAAAPASARASAPAPPAPPPAPARASASARAIVALSGDPADATFQRIRDELRALDVRIATGGAEDADARVVLAQKRVTIALAARHGGGELEVAVRRGEGPEVLALAAVELLRARLLHRDALPPPAAGTDAGGQAPPSTASPAGGSSASPAASATAASPAPPAARAPAPGAPPPSREPSRGAGDDGRPPTRFVASVGPTLLLAGGEIPPTPALSIGVSATFRGWYIAAGGTTTLGGTSWEVPGGRLEHGVALVGAAAGGALSFAGGHGLVTLGAGASVLRLRYQTLLASPVFDGASGTAWAAVPHLEAGLRWFVHDHAGFRLGGLAGAALPAVDIPYPELTAAGSGPAADATRYGRPLLAVSLSLEARL
ncbi:hypothetical protein [Sorangium sp. So ce131]|uniref:hypothetical protein n=1 Tax=Sorangium sp. So ce131 TaxID=3133282 RepID=UPI003F619587